MRPEDPTLRKLVAHDVGDGRSDEKSQVAGRPTGITRRQSLGLMLGVNAAAMPILHELLSSRNDVATEVGQRGLTYPVLYGAALEIGSLQHEPDYAAAFARYCQICTIAGPFYWTYSEPQSGSFSYAGADQCLQFAEAHHILARGHTLVWHEGLPAWVTAELTPRTARDILTRHVNTLVSHYAGRMHSWDVVNEVVGPTPSGILRSTPWLANVGRDYIALAFQTASAADPAAMLGYNEYGLENDSAGADRKRAAVLQLLRELVDTNVPIDYLGIQGHLAAGDTYSDARLGAFLRDVQQLGLRVLVTELDVDDHTLPAAVADRDRAVADVYARFLDVVLSVPVVDAVITWGLTDRHTWLARHAPRADSLPPRPLPFDSSFRPTPAWRVIARRLGIRDTL